MSGPVSGSERDCLSWNFWRAGEAKPAPAAEGGPPYVALRCVAAGRGQLLCRVFGGCKRLLAGAVRPGLLLKSRGSSVLRVVRGKGVFLPSPCTFYLFGFI